MRLLNWVVNNRWLASLMLSLRIRAVVQSLWLMYRQMPDRLRDINKHLSISFMAIMFAGSSLIFSSTTSTVSLNSLLPPSPDLMREIVTQTAVYTPTISEDTDQIVQSLVDHQQDDYISAQLVEIAEDKENGPLAGQGFSYTVQSGDSWDKIAKANSLKTSSMLIANGITESSIRKDPKQLNLRVGQVIFIPGYNIAGGPENWVELSFEISNQRKIETKKDKRIANYKNRRSMNISDLSSGKDLTPYGGFPAGWCTAGVAKYRPDIRSPFGNAKQWVVNAQSRGFVTGKTARVGAVLATSENGRFGHVSYVTAVNGNIVTVREMNYERFGYYNNRSYDPAGAGVLIGYIY